MKEEARVNRQIRTSEVRLIDADGAQLGITPIKEALTRAEEQGLDLVEVSPKSKPPVCRIMDYGKYKYKQSKKVKLAKKKQHVIQVKEIKMRPKIDVHDFNFKTKHMQKFFEEGNKVKVTVRFRGRELSHKEFGEEVLQKVITKFEEIASVESPPKMEGRLMQMVLAPKSQRSTSKKKKENNDAQTENS